MVIAMAFDVPMGIVCKDEFITREEHSAKVIGSGDVEVLSTPSMILFMEISSWKCIQKYLPEGYTTVGVKICVEHKAPAPIRDKILIETKLDTVEERKLVFYVKALWRDKLIGEGIHERYIVNRQRFVDKVKRIISKS